MNINLTLLGQMITFMLFVFFTKQYVWPPIIKALKERQAKIADGLSAAELGHAELARAHEQVAAALQQSKVAAQQMIHEAKKQSDMITEVARQQAQEQSARIIEQAHKEVERMIEQARESLRKQVASLAMLGAQKILGHAIDEQSHLSMLEKLAQDI